MQPLTLTNNQTFTTNELNPSHIASQLKGTDNIQIQQALTSIIKSDSHLLGKIQDRQAFFKKALVNYLPADDSEQSIAICKFVQDQLSHLLTNNIFSSIADAYFRRFSILEIVWQDNKVASLNPLPQTCFEFHNSNTELTDEEKTLDNALMLYDEENSAFSPIPDFRTIQTRSQLLKENTYPISITEILAPLVVIKYFALQKQWARYNEVFSMPLRIGKVKSNNEKEIKAMKEALQNLGSDSAGIIVGDNDIQFKGVDSKAGAETYKTLIDFCNAEISKAIVGHAGGDDSQGGSYAKAKVLDGVRLNVITQSFDLVADAINEQLIKPLVNFNFAGVTNYPQIELTLPSNYLEQSEQDLKIKQLGVAFKKSYFVKKYGLDESDFDIAETTDNFGLKKKLENSHLNGLLF